MPSLVAGARAGVFTKIAHVITGLFKLLFVIVALQWRALTRSCARTRRLRCTGRRLGSPP